MRFFVLLSFLIIGFTACTKWKAKNQTTTVSGDNVMAISFVNNMVQLSQKEIIKADRDTVIIYDTIRWDVRDSGIVVYDFVNDSFLYYKDTILMDDRTNIYDFITFDTSQYFTQRDTTYDNNDDCLNIHLDAENRDSSIRTFTISHLACDEYNQLRDLEGTYVIEQHNDSLIEIETQDLKINGLSFNGTLIMQEALVDSQKQITVGCTGVFASADNQFYWNCSLIYTLTTGGETVHTWSDDVYHIEGSMDGVSTIPEEVAFTANIDTLFPLRTGANCPWISSGEIILTAPERIDRTISFGTNSNCENTGTIYINKKHSHLFIE